jgi:hypothetical protein
MPSKDDAPSTIDPVSIGNSVLLIVVNPATIRHAQVVEPLSLIKNKSLHLKL